VEYEQLPKPDHLQCKENSSAESGCGGQYPDGRRVGSRRFGEGVRFPWFLQGLLADQTVGQQGGQYIQGAGYCSRTPDARAGNQAQLSNQCADHRPQRIPTVQIAKCPPEV